MVETLAEELPVSQQLKNKRKREGDREPGLVLQSVIPDMQVAEDCRFEPV